MTTLVTENLALVAGAPGGIGSLRRLVLDLAINGRLVPQRAEDESGEMLLAQAASRKAEIGKARTSKSRETTPWAPPERALPHGWVWARLADLTTKMGAGSTPLGGKQVYITAGVMFLRSQNVWNAGLRLDDVARIPPEVHQDMAGTHVVAGDLLFNITGASIGRCATVPTDFEGGNVSQHVVIIRPALSQLQPYLHKVLISDRVQDLVMAEQVGVSREGLSVAKLSEFRIPLPPLAEQHRIVAKVDELMALCDRLEARKQDAEAAHAQLVQVLLDCLTKARDADEFHASWRELRNSFDMVLSTESSIDRLVGALVDLAVKGGLVLPDPASVDWHFVRLGAVIDLVSGQHLGPEEYQMTPGADTIPYLTGPAEFGEKTPAPTRFTKERRAVARQGDLLLTVKGSGVGSTNIVSQPELAISRQLMAVRPKGVEGAYLHILLKSLLKHFQDRSIGIAIPGIGRADVLEVEVGLPPKAEQLRIVTKLTELLALCDQLKAHIAAARRKHSQLAHVLVEHAVAA